MPSQSSTGLPVIFTICDFPGILFKTPTVLRHQTNLWHSGLL